MISSIVLFFKRDCAGGVGPVVDAPRPGVGAAPVVPVVAPAVVVEGAVVAGLLSAAVLVDVLAGCVDGVVPAGFPKSPPVDAAGWVFGADVAVVPGVLVSVDLGAPNKPPVDGAAAGVEEGVAEEVVPPPRAGNRGFAGVVVDMAGVEDSAVVVVVVPEEGVLKSDDACAPCPPAGAPKRGLAPLSAEVAGVVDSAGLSLPAFEKRPPPVGADGVDPNNDFCGCCAFDPKRPPPDCGCDPPPNSDGVVEPLVAVVVVVDGAAEEVVAVFVFPKRPPGFCVVWPKSD